MGTKFAVLYLEWSGHLLLVGMSHIHFSCKTSAQMDSSWFPAGFWYRNSPMNQHVEEVDSTGTSLVIQPLQRPASHCDFETGNGNRLSSDYVPALCSTSISVCLICLIAKQVNASELVRVHFYMQWSRQSPIIYVDLRILDNNCLSSSNQSAASSHVEWNPHIFSVFWSAQSHALKRRWFLPPKYQGWLKELHDVYLLHLLAPYDSYDNAINAFPPFRDGELLKVWSASSKGNSATHSIWKMDTASMSCKAPRMLLTLWSSLLSKNATISFQMPTVKCEKHAAWWCTMMPKTEDGAIATALMKLWSFLSCQQTMLHTSCELPWLPHGSAGNCCVSTRHARRERVQWSIWIYRDGGTGCIYLYAQDTLIIWCHQQR